MWGANIVNYLLNPKIRVAMIIGVKNNDVRLICLAEWDESKRQGKAEKGPSDQRLIHSTVEKNAVRIGSRSKHQIPMRTWGR